MHTVTAIAYHIIHVSPSTMNQQFVKCTVHNVGTYVANTVFTWLNTTPRIVATLDWYHNRFQNYGYKHLPFEHRVMVDFE